MSPLRTRRRPRGFTLLEVTIAGALLLAAVVGLIGVVRITANANAVAHRRTELIYFRSALLDRLAVTPRLGLSNSPSQGTWMVDSCWDVNATLVGNNGGAAGSLASYAAGYACPPQTLYRSWVMISPGTATGGNCAAAGACFQVSLYVERTDAGCTSANRYSSVGCAAADLLFTD